MIFKNFINTWNKYLIIIIYIINTRTIQPSSFVLVKVLLEFQLRLGLLFSKN